MLRIARLISITYLVVCVAAVGLMSVIGPLGYAPFPLPLGPGREPITVAVAASSETQQWLQDAAQRFAQTNPRIGGRAVTITIDTSGSSTLVQNIVQGTRTPTVVIPASTLQLDQLKAAWQQRPASGVLFASNAPQSLVTTPLVLIAWEARAKALWPSGPQNAWLDLHDAVTNPNGWQQVGKPEWGAIKFGHARPTTANSGIQTLLALAYAKQSKTSGLGRTDVDDPALQQWLVAVETSVQDFTDSTSGMVEDMLRYGPSKYDFVSAYENLAIAAFATGSGGNGALHVYYPPATMISDHPYAILGTSWVTPAQQQAAALFRDYLLAVPAQQLALTYGFRPVNQAVSLTSADAANPFTKYKDFGIDRNGIGQPIQLPSLDVVDQLTQFWRQKINR